MLTAVKREKFAKNEKNTLKEDLSLFTIQSLILYQYLADLLKSYKYLKMGEFGLVGNICQSNFVRLWNISK